MTRLNIRITLIIFWLIAFLIHLTLSHTVTEQVHIEYDGIFFMSGHGVLGNIRRIYSHPISHSHLRPSTGVV